MEYVKTLLFSYSPWLVLVLLGVSAISSLLALCYFAKMQQWRHLNGIQSMVVRRILHEVRDPLNGILGYTEILSSDYYGELEPLQREAICNILACGRKLANFTKKFSSLLTNQSGKIGLEFSMVHLRQLLESLIEGHTTITIKSKSVGKIVGDNEKLFIAFSNIVEFIYLNSELKDTAEISMEETGKEVHIVFAFHVGDNFDKTTTPLSVRLCKVIIEMHKGRLALKISKDRFTQVHIIIPKRKRSLFAV